MPRISSGKRYAQAAFELGLEKNELDSWQTDLRRIASLTADEEVMAFLENPRLPFAAKRTLLEKGLGKINPLAFNLVLLLASKGRLKLAADISQQYDGLLDFHRGIDHAEVIAALPLNDKNREAISRRLGEMVERRVVIDARVDPSILGGFIARIGDRLIDGSLRQRLETLKRRLVEAGR
jgi:F-type H+-transporting ATPase subunit delta